MYTCWVVESHIGYCVFRGALRYDKILFGPHRYANGPKLFCSNCIGISYYLLKVLIRDTHQLTWLGYINFSSLRVSVGGFCYCASGCLRILFYIGYFGEQPIPGSL